MGSPSLRGEPRPAPSPVGPGFCSRTAGPSASSSARPPSLWPPPFLYAKTMVILQRQGSGDRENPFSLALLGRKFISCSQGNFKTRKRRPQLLRVYWTGSRSWSGKSYNFTPAAGAEYELCACREKGQCCLIFFLLSLARILSDGKHARCQGDGPHCWIPTLPSGG